MVRPDPSTDDLRDLYGRDLSDEEIIFRWPCASARLS